MEGGVPDFKLHMTFGRGPVTKFVTVDVSSPSPHVEALTPGITGSRVWAPGADTG